MHTFGRSPVEFVEGHGMKLTGDDDREYLDFLAGIGVCSLGHGNFGCALGARGTDQKAHACLQLFLHRAARTGRGAAVQAC
ncbi:MAG: hypothetical protein ACLU37_04645 [Collinsella sp.]